MKQYFVKIGNEKIKIGPGTVPSIGKTASMKVIEKTFKKLARLKLFEIKTYD